MANIGRRVGRVALGTFLIGCVLTVGTIPAIAGLGGDAASIESDVSALAGKMSQSISTQYQDQSSSFPPSRLSPAKMSRFANIPRAPARYSVLHGRGVDHPT
jgi:hypothetical protein